ncbi:MAG: cell division protein FtsZ [Bacteroidota bacterium]
MIHFDLPKEKSSIIKVIGVGGGGSNAVNHMFAQSIDGVNFVICNTDAQAIANSKVPNKIQLGPHLTQGLGAGANPDIGRQATEESLEEIRRILEVNTKMAFITAGMGGGTGTGGAPIISKICKDLGILTVGIVTTPFGYEGKKRMQQAQEGIARMKEHVDTLLIISNDKLRHQFGNLKMKEAFAKADNVLATAAKCITDVINSTGQINVDFADVCTVMKNGGKAILGNAAASGEDRAQRAIEEALNSPLLNDNEIKGARWLLININSAEGEFEYTMDEVEIIQNYVLAQAGEDTDVILGMGYDATLGDQIGITLIATGFEAKDVSVSASVVAEKREAEKIVLTLEEEVKVETKEVVQAPVLSIVKPDALIPFLNDAAEEEKLKEVSVQAADESGIATTTTAMELTQQHLSDDLHPVISEEVLTDESLISALPAVSGGYLTPPTVIYEEESLSQTTVQSASEPDAQVQAPVIEFIKEEDEIFHMQLVEKDVAEIDPADARQLMFANPSDDQGVPDEEEEQRKKASERLQKLRNLSFNIYGSDANNDFDTVPAYLRRNLELYSTISPAENFYSNYTVKADENNNTHISSMNSFLDGNKPD